MTKNFTPILSQENTSSQTNLPNLKVEQQNNLNVQDPLILNTEKSLNLTNKLEISDSHLELKNQENIANKKDLQDDDDTSKKLDPTHFGDWQVNCKTIDF
jgi:hypothetical protein